MSTAPQLQDPFPAAPAAASRRPRRHLMVAVVAGAVALTAAASTAVVLRGSQDRAVQVNGLLTLPEQLGALKPLPVADDLTKSADWTRKADEQLAGASYVARTFGTEPQAPTTRVVVAKTDLTGKLELAWAADQGKEFGNVRCTQNVTLGARTAPRPTLSLCWRTTPTLSAYALLIDVKHPVSADAAAGAVDEAWEKLVP